MRSAFHRPPGRLIRKCDFCGSNHVRVLLNKLGFVQPDAALTPQLNQRAACLALTNYIPKQAEVHGGTRSDRSYGWDIEGIQIPMGGYGRESLVGCYVPVYEYQIRLNLRAIPNVRFDLQRYERVLQRLRIVRQYDVSALTGNVAEMLLDYKMMEMFDAPLLCSAPLTFNPEARDSSCPQCGYRPNRIRKATEGRPVRLPLERSSSSFDRLAKWSYVSGAHSKIWDKLANGSDLATAIGLMFGIGILSEGYGSIVPWIAVISLGFAGLAGMVCIFSLSMLKS
ncbi:MAG: hypothetical protein K8I27_14940 [Planctomycetes bacterium]|nr:hypothetical protein [Planctomycetota bacterium]